MYCAYDDADIAVPIAKETACEGETERKMTVRIQKSGNGRPQLSPAFTGEKKRD